jgi:protein-tyrosine-phosphatase
MAAAFLERRAGGRVRVLSAGSDPADAIHPNVAAAMAEIGIDLSGRRPKLLADADVRASDVVITMGCGDACPVYPGKRYEDWDVDDPTGKPLEDVRAIRDDIASRVDRLLEGLSG